MNENFFLPRGVKSYLPLEGEEIRALELKSRKIFSGYGYKEIITPCLDSLALFDKNIGSSSDVVERQILKIEDKANLCLRPESTAQVARTYIQEGIHKSSPIFKTFYIGSMFRGERPQKGRLREFHHIGAEYIGSYSYFADVEVIKLAGDIIANVFGVKDFRLVINSLGCSKDKTRLEEIIRDVFSGKLDCFCDNCRRRFNTNPLRILDCKSSKCQKEVHSAGVGRGHLCDECESHFNAVLSVLDNLGVRYEVSPYLVRGLDYYTQTVFEFISEDLGAQATFAAGGRYNNLIESVGGPQTAAVGFALGFERAFMIRGGTNTLPSLKAFVVYTNESLRARAFDILCLLRDGGISADMRFSVGGLRKQLKHAQRKNARFAVIVGEDEIKKEEVILRDMVVSSQRNILLKDMVEVLKNA